jgi:hypothetical protein
MYYIINHKEDINKKKRTLENDKENPKSSKIQKTNNLQDSKLEEALNVKINKN